MKTNGKCNNSHAPRSCSLYIGISDLRLPVCIAIDLAHLSRYSQNGGGSQASKNPLVRSYLRVPQAAGQVKLWMISNVN